MGGDIFCHSGGVNQGASFEFRILLEETSMMRSFNIQQAREEVKKEKEAEALKEKEVAND